MIVVLLAACAATRPAPREAHTGCRDPLGDYAAALVHAPSSPPAAAADLEFGRGWLGNLLLCERALRADDLTKYGWVIEFPGQGFAWTTEPFGSPEAFLARAAQCEVRWDGEAWYIDGWLTVHVSDARFSRRGQGSCRVGRPFDAFPNWH